jgi:hypothetical protein
MKSLNFGEVAYAIADMQNSLCKVCQHELAKYQLLVS